MTALFVIATILFTTVALTVIGNFIRLFVESKKLKGQGKTPLIGRTSLTIILAAIAEVIVLFLLLKVVAILGVSNVFSVVLTFVVLYYGRQIAAYLATWSVWSLFVRSAKQKEINKIKQDVQQEKAGQ